MSRVSYSGRVPSTGGSVWVAMACRVACAYPDRLPRPAELMQRFGMSRASAYRWVAAMRDARGIA
jgi:hypothetical protein